MKTEEEERKKLHRSSLKATEVQSSSFNKTTFSVSQNSP